MVHATNLVRAHQITCGVRRTGGSYICSFAKLLSHLYIAPLQSYYHIFTLSPHDSQDAVQFWSTFSEVLEGVHKEGGEADEKNTQQFIADYGRLLIYQLEDVSVFTNNNNKQ